MAKDNSEQNGNPTNEGQPGGQTDQDKLDIVPPKVARRFRTAGESYFSDALPSMPLDSTIMAYNAISSLNLPEIQAVAQMAAQTSEALQIANSFKPLLMNLQQQIAESFQDQQRTLAGIIRESQVWMALSQSTATAANLVANNQASVLSSALQSHVDRIAQIMSNSAIYESIIESLASMAHTAWYPSFRHIRKQMRQRLFTAFTTAKLWPTPSMSDELVDRILVYAERGSRRDIALVVWHHYSRNNHKSLKQAIAKWWDDPEYMARRTIIDTALSAHCQRMYALTIPALLAQCEGIAGDFVRNHTSTSGTNVPPKLGKTGQVIQHAVRVAGNAGIDDPDEADILHMVLIEAVLTHIQTVAFENTDFTTQYESIRKRRTLNRHGTLHGIQINYSSAMNSLRCFLLLDALYALRKHARMALSQ